MASPMPIHAIQPSFTAGEISKDVASRVDLEKYQSALLQAENVYIRPYGGLYRRSGSVYHGRAKYDDKKVSLLRFNFTENICYMLEVGDRYIRVWRDGKYLGVELETPWTESDLPHLRFTQSADIMYVCSKTRPVQTIKRFSETDWKITEFALSKSPFEPINLDMKNTITASALTGDVTLVSAQETFVPEFKNAYMKIMHTVEAKTISAGHGTSASILCGGSWKIITHGTWTGSIRVEKSSDNISWEMHRMYTSKNDYNAIESGDFEDYTYIRVVSAISSGSATSDLTTFPYTHEGIIKLTEIVDEKTATAKVVEALGALDETADWNIGCWNDKYGYPACAAFFQDRLVFAGSIKQPHTIWLSRSGDYPNFGVEKASGQVTDDSSIQVSLISREMFEIRHLIPSQDLVILTVGNEWIISGNEIVAPTKITPKVQTARGCNDVEPQYIGSRIVYVQRRGSTIRDIGYTYESDNYNGQDLTLLAKHLVKNQEIVDCSYSQEPDSIIYFVRNDGVLICLTYLREQDVFAWSHLVTDGIFESVISIPNSEDDTVYVLVKRTVDGNEVRYIESFAATSSSEWATDHVMVDSAKIIEYEEEQTIITGLQHLKGKSVQVVVDKYDFPAREYLVEDDGSVELPAPFKKVVVGLPYTVKLEQPNFEIALQDGTMQGRKKMVASAVLRLENSYGGMVGPTFDLLDAVTYEDNAFTQLELYTGDKEITMTHGGFNNHGRVCILHNDPYPFVLSAVIRKVAFGG